MKACIFDLDGTLYQTERIAIPAFEKTFQDLRQQGKIEENDPTESMILSSFGLKGEQIWAELLPKADHELREEADRVFLKYEKELIHNGKGKFYPGVKKGLVHLKEQGWSLFIVSNGIPEYVNAVLASAALTELFTEILTLGNQPTVEKPDAVRDLIQRYSIKKGYVIGDRKSDVEAAKKNDLIAIGCKYKGFPHFSKKGELNEADFIIQHFRELVEIVVKP